jgi:hypothetical protein
MKKQRGHIVVLGLSMIASSWGQENQDRLKTYARMNSQRQVMHVPVQRISEPNNPGSDNSGFNNAPVFVRHIYGNLEDDYSSSECICAAAMCGACISGSILVNLGCTVFALFAL